MRSGFLQIRIDQDQKETVLSQFANHKISPADFNPRSVFCLIDTLSVFSLALRSMVFSSSQTDYELIQKIALGDKKAFELLYYRYQKEVLGVATRLMKSKALAEEIVQNVWLKMIQKASEFKDHGSARSWLLTITKNMCLNEIKSSQKWHYIDSEEAEIFFESAEENHFSNDFWNELEIEKAKKCLETLNERQRVALVLFYLEEKPLKELAEELSLQVNAVKALLFRARQRMLQCGQGDVHDKEK